MRPTLEDSPPPRRERRCPFCHHRARWRTLVVCALCGAGLSVLDELRPWRRLRRVARALREGGKWSGESAGRPLRG